MHMLLQSAATTVTHYQDDIVNFVQKVEKNRFMQERQKMLP